MLTVPTHNPNGTKIEKVAIQLSGGADSSLLAYLIAKDIEDRELNISVIPVSVKRPRPTHPLYASAVTDFLVERFSCVRPITIENSVGDEHQFFKDMSFAGFKNNKWQLMYNGITKAPPATIQSSFEDQNNPIKFERLDGVVEEPNFFAVHEDVEVYGIRPFININKKVIAEWYEKEGLLDSLFPITRSCESRDQRNWNTHCGVCWWCDERQWAFNRLV